MKDDTVYLFLFLLVFYFFVSKPEFYINSSVITQC
uniref:Uncharacterized protein n=1 Tax=Anguilla anguilla TaxID=7936 RepID=A0A0E9TCX9_ANGAN